MSIITIRMIMTDKKRRMQSAFLVLLACGFGAAQANMHSAESVHQVAQQQQQQPQESLLVAGRQDVSPRVSPPPAKRAVFYSEHRLRSAVELTNYDLRQLKRQFLAAMTDVYLALKMDPLIGFQAARQTDSEAAVANVLVAAELNDLVVKKFTIERRLLAGLKSAFVRFMPMDTLVRLYKRYESFAWLRYQSQCDLSQRLPAGSKDEHLEILYGLIEARARARAADDVIALSADNMQRILQTFQWFLIESRHSQRVQGAELASMAEQARRVLNYYLEQVVERAAEARREYVTARRLARPLYDQFGGRRKFLRFVDGLINVEALDIDLNEEASQLDLPPTITKQIIDNLLPRWIPGYVLKSLEEDRGLLIDKRKQLLHLVRLHPDKQNADFAQWSANILSYVCRNQVVYY